jgi:hypothetical protein
MPRIAQRLVFGAPKRDEFELFSAQEEEALWNLREAQRQAHARAMHPPAIRHAAQSKPKRAPSIEWPKVVVSGGSTCVPTREFADSPQWREHLVCWNHTANAMEATP